LKEVLKKMSVPPFAETRSYVKRVLGLYNLFLTSPPGR
jgi:soluble lytic murein transglycosylase-like protein